MRHLSSHGIIHLGLTGNARKLHDRRNHEELGHAHVDCRPCSSRPCAPTQLTSITSTEPSTTTTKNMATLFPVRPRRWRNGPTFSKSDAVTRRYRAGWEQQRRPRATMGRSSLLGNADPADHDRNSEETAALPTRRQREDDRVVHCRGHHTAPYRSANRKQCRSCV